MFDLTDQVAVITGSTKGIGKSIAEHMARAGAKVVISSRKADACNDVANALKSDGHNALAVPCHVGKKDDIKNLVDTTIQEWGQIDILVCNAATNPVFGPMASVSDEAWDKVMTTNVKSQFWLCNMVIPDMAKRKKGCVIIISSVGMFRGNPVIGAYNVSKAAEAQLARNYAVEWGKQGVRVNTIAPGLIKTDFARALWDNPEALKRTEMRTPLGRIGEPDDIGGVALFLASDAARFMTGQTVIVDGGVMTAEGG